MVENIMCVCAAAAAPVVFHVVWKNFSPVRNILSGSLSAALT